MVLTISYKFFMKKYYIIRADGSSIFEHPYPEDFIYHCLFNLLDTAPDEKFQLCCIDFKNLVRGTSLPSTVGTDLERGTCSEVLYQPFSEVREVENIRTYILN